MMLGESVGKQWDLHILSCKCAILSVCGGRGESYHLILNKTN